MGRADHRVGLVEVVGADADLEQTVEELLQDLGIVVDAAQQDGLAAERDATVGQEVAGGGDIGGQLGGVRKMERQPHPVAAQHCDQFRGDPLRQETGNAASDAQKLDVFDLAQR